MVWANECRLIGGLLFAAVACALSVASASDNLIVPGSRIGAVHVGMDVASLLASKGPPEESHHYTGYESSYSWPDVSVGVLEQTGKVYSVRTRSPNYTLRDGLAVGSSEETLLGKRPGYYARLELTPHWLRFCYLDEGLVVDSNRGQLSRIEVVSAGARQTAVSGCDLGAGDFICHRREGDAPLAGDGCRRR